MVKYGLGVIALLFLLTVSNYAVRSIRAEKDEITLSDVRKMCMTFPRETCYAGLSEFTTFEDAVVFNAPAGECGVAMFANYFRGQSHAVYVVWTDCDGMMHRGTPNTVSGQMIIFKTPD
jgi:hypothetical protein